MKNDIRKRIGHALTALPNEAFTEVAKQLLGVLGYESERAIDLSGSVHDFLDQFRARNENTQTEQAFREDVQSVRILFQVTDTEIATARNFLSTDDFDSGNARSFLFVAVELNGASYPRGQYAALTREINKRFSMPSVVLFKTATAHLTLSFVHAAVNKG